MCTVCTKCTVYTVSTVSTVFIYLLHIVGTTGISDCVLALGFEKMERGSLKPKVCKDICTVHGFL